LREGHVMGSRGCLVFRILTTDLPGVQQGGIVADWCP
jgi:hypothetical protein